MYIVLNFLKTIRILKVYQGYFSVKTQYSKNKDNGIWPHHFMAIRWGNDGNFIFSDSKITADGDCSHEIKRCLLLGKRTMTNLDSILKSQRYYFANKGPSSQSYGFSRSHVWVWELGHKEGWAPKNLCFWTVVLKRLLRVPWTARRSNQ